MAAKRKMNEVPSWRPKTPAVGGQVGRRVMHREAMLECRVRHCCQFATGARMAQAETSPTLRRLLGTASDAVSQPRRATSASGRTPLACSGQLQSRQPAMPCEPQCLLELANPLIAFGQRRRNGTRLPHYRLGPCHATQEHAPSETPLACSGLPQRWEPPRSYEPQC